MFTSACARPYCSPCRHLSTFCQALYALQIMYIKQGA